MVRVAGIRGVYTRSSMTAMCNEEGNFHALSWFLTKKGSKPIPVCLDVDGTTFLCNQKDKRFYETWFLLCFQFTRFHQEESERKLASIPIASASFCLYSVYHKSSFT